MTFFSSLRFPFGYPSVMRVFPSVPRVAEKGPLTMIFHFPSVPLRFPFGFPSVMRVFYKFLKSDCWNCPRKVLMKFIPLRSQNPSNPEPPQNLLNGPSVRNCLNDKISFGFPSVTLRFRGCVIWEIFGPPGPNWIWEELKLPEAVLNKGSLTREKR